MWWGASLLLLGRVARLLGPALAGRRVDVREALLVLILSTWPAAERDGQYGRACWVLDRRADAAPPRRPSRRRRPVHRK